MVKRRVQMVAHVFQHLEHIIAYVQHRTLVLIVLYQLIVVNYLHAQMEELVYIPDRAPLNAIVQ